MKLDPVQQLPSLARSDINALRALLTPGRVMTLTLSDERVFLVRWRHRDGGLKPEPALFYTPSDASDPFFIELYLETV